MEDPSVDPSALALRSLNISHAQAVLIAGPSGSGKSYISRHLASLIGFPVVSIDRFFLNENNVPLEYLDGDYVRQWESPGAIDVDYLILCLKEIIRGNKIDYPIYSYENNQRCGYEELHIRGGCFILEGLNTLWFSGILREEGLRCFKIFVDVDLSKRDAIIEKRDREERKKGGVFVDRIRVLRAGERKWVYMQRGDADLVMFRDIKSIT